MSDWASTIDWAYRLIVLIGGGFALLWMGRALIAQEKTIKAQSDRMAAMQTLLATMDVVLKSTDEQTMLARLKAHKEFVEHEKEAFKEESTRLLDDARGAFAALMLFSVNAMPYVPKARREEFIDSLAPAPARAIDALRTLSKLAPDLTTPALPLSLKIPGRSTLLTDPELLR